MKALRFLSAAIVLSAPIIAFAQISYTPSAPLPLIPSGPVTKEVYLFAVFRLGIGIAGVLAVIRMTYCGFQAVSSVSPSARQDASHCVWASVSGLLLAISAWYILSLVNPQLLSLQGSVAIPTPSGAAPTPPSSIPAPNPTCDTQNLCAANLSTTCNYAACAPYIPYTNSQSVAYVSPELLRAIMVNESSCNIAAVNAGQCGLMQLAPATANLFKETCRDYIPEYYNRGTGTYVDPSFTITCGWLTTNDAIHAEGSVCLASAYLYSLATGACAGSITNRQLAAAYQGGPSACALSTDCPSPERNCELVPMRNWECPFDDSAHATCNTGFQQTRDYVPKILECVKQYVAGN